MRLPSWPPIPHQQVENNTLLFFHDTMCRTARGNVLPFRSYKEEHRSVSFLIRIRQETVLVVLIKPGRRLSTRRPPNRCSTDQQAFKPWCLSQLGFQATLWRSFCLCQFRPQANFALRWSPTSRAKLRESVSDYTQFDWWAPVASCAFTRGGK